MSWVSYGLKAAGRVAMVAGPAAYRLAKSGTGTRMALGMGIGAAYGAITNPYNDTNMGIGRIARTALYGGLAGGATSLIRPGMGLLGKATRQHGFSATKAAISKGSTAAGLVMRYPLTAAGIVGGAYAIHQTNKTPYDSQLANSTINQPIVDRNIGPPGLGMSREEQMLGEMNSGISPMGGLAGGTQIRNQRLMQSTVGLTNGLHRGRHS